MEQYRKLSPKEEGIICRKETEPPFTGEYTDCFTPGIFVCKRCDAPLYLSEQKFSSPCGWPSFEEEIPGRLLRSPDPDKIRTEICCARCNGHLGHVFMGEHLSKSDTRHCVNSASLLFIPALSPEGFERALFAGGCFWGMQKLFESIPGIISTEVGYTGGIMTSPSYEEVCTGKTGHAEAVEILFDPKIVSYAELVKIFFQNIDPSQENGQGFDIGTQYRAEIFYLTPKQRDTANTFLFFLQEKHGKIATKISPASSFYPAEEYHRQYYRKHEF